MTLRSFKKDKGPQVWLTADWLNVTDVLGRSNVNLVRRSKTGAFACCRETLKGRLRVTATDAKGLIARQGRLKQVNQGKTS